MRLGTAPFTVTMVALCVIIFAVDFFMNGALQPALAVHPASIQQGQWWRLITAGFVHNGLPHIFFNMYALLQAGSFVEFCYGTPRYALIYVAALLAGNIAAFVTTLGHDVHTLGASGAIMGVFGAMAILGFKLPRLRGALLQAALLPILLTLGYGLIVPFISNAAHIGGVLAGALVALMLNPVRGRELVPIGAEPAEPSEQ
jgi:rhomboid protease GluP